MARGDLLLDCVEGLPKESYGFRVFEEVLTVVGDDSKEVGGSGRSGTAVVHVNGG